MSDGDGVHNRHENFPWTIAVVDHPDRSESSAYRASRRLMNRLVDTLDDWTFAPNPYQDHHGGGIWVRDDEGWMCMLSPLGIEWSAQFCADPAKVDRARQQVARLIAAFPATLPGYQKLGYTSGSKLLATRITTAAHVAAWTDSIFNASVPLPPGPHSGVLPKGAGYHHYPKPIVDIDHFRFDDFQLFVVDSAGRPAVVVPVSPRGSGDARVRLLAAHPESPYIDRLVPRARGGGRLTAQPGSAAGDVLSASDPLAVQAFAAQ